MQIDIEILPEKLTARVPRGTALADVLESHGIPINYPCGRRGTCGSCCVQFLEGAPAPRPAEEEHFSAAELERGERLGCQAVLESNARLTVPGTTRLVEPRILTSSGQRDVALHPRALKVYLRVPQATVAEPRADHELVQDILRPMIGSDLTPSLHYLRQLPRALREEGGSITVTACAGHLVSAEPGNTMEQLYGVAVDVGTTTVAAALFCLRTGEQLALLARLNPQVSLGEDVISRLTYAYESPERLRQLQGKITGCLNQLLGDLCATAGVEQQAVAMWSIAGNAAMNHLLLGVPPEFIGLAPYTPVYRGTELWRAADIGLGGHGESRVQVLPNIGGFVGGDTVAGLLACDFLHHTRPRLLIDIGTNCEVVLGRAGEMASASSPAGPAMEGGCISHGMRAEPGAIHDARWEDGRLVLDTLEDAPPRGLCGSGLFHVVYTLRSLGIVNPSGLFARPGNDGLSPDAERFLRERLGNDEDGKPRLLLAPGNESDMRDVWLTQRDVREFQLAKAAIAAAWQTLCHELGIEPEEIEEVSLAGAFGNFLRPDAALAMGLVPSVPLERIRSVGNTALEGARLALLNSEFADEANSVIDRVRFVELAGRDDFQETFALGLSLSNI